VLVAKPEKTFASRRDKFYLNYRRRGCTSKETLVSYDVSKLVKQQTLQKEMSARVETIGWTNSRKQTSQVSPATIKWFPDRELNHYNYKGLEKATFI